jgi:hypothetical protein
MVIFFILKAFRRNIRYTSRIEYISTTLPQRRNEHFFNGIILKTIFFSEIQSFLMRHFKKEIKFSFQKSINLYYIIKPVPI